MATPAPLAFTVRRCKPELVAPAKETPREFKQLSDIDRQLYLQFQSPHLNFYAYNPSMQGKDPVNVIKEAIALALVFYYPYAGRLRQGPENKIIVDCTGEGVMFIEADADVTIEHFGNPIQPPFPGYEQLIEDVAGSVGIFNSPLLLFQVTRLKCGGFILAFRLNHPMSDALGIVQLLRAIGEIARGAHTPSIVPVWQRELLCARNPPRVTCNHNEYGNNNAVDDDHVVDDATVVSNIVPGFRDSNHTAAHRCFILGPNELSNIHKWIPPYLRPCSNFEVVTACILRCYAIAAQPNPNEEIRMLFLVNARSKFNPPLPKGYYGNVLALPAVVTTARKLCLNSLGFALELVRNAKNKVTEEYMRSLADFIETTNGQPKGLGAYVVSDLTSVGFDLVDYGWGQPIYTGPNKAAPDDISNPGTYYLPFKNSKGERGIMLVVALPTAVMERFAVLLEELKSYDPESGAGLQDMALPVTHARL